MDLNRKLKIQIGVVNRISKDLQFYTREIEENKERIQKMKLNDECRYMIRKQEEVLSESYMMIPDTQLRLEDAIKDLELTCNNASDDDLILQANELLTNTKI